MKPLLLAALSLTLCVQPLEAGFEFPKTFDHARLQRIRLSPYECEPYLRETSFELRCETEVDPYRPAGETTEESDGKRLRKFRPRESLSPPEWGSRFGIMRSIESREICLGKPPPDQDYPFDERVARLAMLSARITAAEYEMEQSRKAQWDTARKRVARLLRQGQADAATRERVLRTLEKAEWDVAAQQAVLWKEVARLRAEMTENE